MVYSARRLASFCRAPRDDFTLIPNVTYGLNTILKGYQANYGETSHVILWDTSYGSLKKMAQRYCKGRVTEIPVSDYFDQWWDDSSDTSSDVFERAFIDTLEQMKNGQNQHSIENSLLILDHTTSNTALNMPIERLAKLAKEANMLVMVDGAHGLLAHELTLNPTDLPHVDFYVGNGHKWLSCPRGIGFLYCPHDHLRDSILEQPAVISHGIGQGFQSRFLWDGCRDYAAALSVPAVLDHWEKYVGVDRDMEDFQQTIYNKLKEATDLLGLSWHGNLDRYLLAPLEFHSPMMALVRLPESVQSSPSTSAHAKAVQDYLYDNMIEVPIKCIRGVLYVRISCHVYNEIHEYQRLADTILKFQKTW